MTWTLVQFEDGGRWPVDEFLHSLKQKHRGWWSATLAHLERLRVPTYHQQLTRLVDVLEQIHELEVPSDPDEDGVVAVVAILFFFTEDQIVLTNGYVRSARQAPPLPELSYARRCKQMWS